MLPPLSLLFLIKVDSSHRCLERETAVFKPMRDLQLVSKKWETFVLRNYFLFLLKTIQEKSAARFPPPHQPTPTRPYNCTTNNWTDGFTRSNTATGSHPHAQGTPAGGRGGPTAQSLPGRHVASRVHTGLHSQLTMLRWKRLRGAIPDRSLLGN